MRRFLSICIVAALSWSLQAQGYTNPVIKGMNSELRSNPAKDTFGSDYRTHPGIQSNFRMS